MNSIITIEFTNGLAVPYSHYGDFHLLHNDDKKRDLHQYTDDYWAFEFILPEGVEVDPDEHDDAIRVIDLFLAEFNKEFHLSMSMKKKLSLCFVLRDEYAYDEIFDEEFIFDEVDYIRGSSTDTDADNGETVESTTANLINMS